MKRFIGYLYFIIIVFAGCVRSDSIDPIFPWPKSGDREADSLFADFVRHYGSYNFPDVSESLAERYCSIANLRRSNPLLQARAAYARACIMKKKHIPCAGEVEKGKSYIDSASHIYDWRMLTYISLDEDPNSVSRYNKVVDNMSYFHKIGAAVEEAKHLNYLGNLMNDFKDAGRAAQYYAESQRIYDSLGLISNGLVARLNSVLPLKRPASDSAYAALRRDSLVRSNPYVNVLLMQNSFIRTDSIQFLDEAISTYSKFSGLPDNLPMLMAFKGDYLRRNGRAREGLNIIESALDSIKDRKYRSQYILLMHYFKSEALSALGMQDSSFMEFVRAWEWRDSLDAEMNKPGVYATDANLRINLVDQNARLERLRIVYLCIIAILGLIIIILFIAWRYRKMNEIKRKKELEMQAQIDKGRQSIAAQSVVMEENEKVLGEIMSRLSVLKDSGELDTQSADSIMKMLRMHKSNEKNRQGYLQLQLGTDSHFMIRMKEDYPTLTEGQIRLAALIASGADSRQICGILNVEQSSVHKSRYRLRQRLGLSKDESLEDFLRRYNSSI